MICLLGLTISTSQAAVNIIGQKDLFDTGLTDLYTDGTPVPSLWINNSTARTLSMAPTASSAADSVVTSESLDLSTVGAVYFTAKLRVHETSPVSNFETGDRFKAELLYHVGGGVLITLNLISQWDVGGGESVTSPTGILGLPNGYLNGFTGTLGTDAFTGMIYNITSQSYNAYRFRDEFNQQGMETSELLDYTFDLAAQIPAEATDVVLKVYGAGISGSEFFDVSEVKFLVPEPGGCMSLLACSLVFVAMRRRIATGGLAD